jgi:hypothetical protein
VHSKRGRQIAHRAAHKRSDLPVPESLVAPRKASLPRHPGGHFLFPPFPAQTNEVTTAINLNADTQIEKMSDENYDIMCIRIVE